jgi:hypothetical protein
MGTGNAGRWVAAAALTLVVLGCGKPGVADGDSSPMRSPGPTAAASTPPGDEAPHEAENNGGKRRHELTAEERRAGDGIAARIRPKLTALRTAEDFSPASTRRALLELGLRPDDVQVTAMWPPAGSDTPPPGAVFAVRFAGSGCVIGSVRTNRLQIEVTGASPEFGCLEPRTH